MLIEKSASKRFVCQVLPAEENILLSIPQPVGFIGLKKSLGSRVAARVTI